MSRSLAVGLLVLAAAALVFAGATSSDADHAASTIDLLAIDARPEGNTATTLGHLDGCAAAGIGELVSVDYVVNAVPDDRPLIGFEARIRYNPRLLEVVAVQNDFLLAGEGVFQPFDGLTDALPDTDGEFRLVVLDTASQTFPPANVESGAGVLSRITFRTKAKGISRVRIGFERRPDLLYPLLQDTQNETIGVDHLGRAVVASGRDCPWRWEEPRIRRLPPLSKLIDGDR